MIPEEEEADVPVLHPKHAYNKNMLKLKRKQVFNSVVILMLLRDTKTSDFLSNLILSCICSFVSRKMLNENRYIFLKVLLTYL